MQILIRYNFCLPGINNGKNKHTSKKTARTSTKRFSLAWVSPDSIANDMNTQVSGLWIKKLMNAHLILNFYTDARMLV